ncbi:hypothetical protein [Flavobacterium beibuense]|uniref:Uncharacterized protein n=1 Tax=Flavobacterium beibuense TaxID=657326 RepID=A0A444WGF6_9FLAO|nr:hypothetical protein [Flavobacterium beibuense]RYJ44804.1 hypothetical protein NU09_0438 [Flavobacterium beibuense]
MTFRSLSDVISCIKQWNNIRNNGTEVVNYLNLGNAFSYTLKSTTSDLHAYPGVCNGNEFYMFLIPANQDTNQSEADLFNAITICQVSRVLGDPHTIPEPEALNRINAWSKNYSQWANSQISRAAVTDGIFQVFNMPSTYMKPNHEYVTFFALKTSPKATTGFDADLVTNDPASSSSFYDTVVPMPPYTALPQSSFYLLSLATV